MGSRIKSTKIANCLLALGAEAVVESGSGNIFKEKHISRSSLRPLVPLEGTEGLVKTHLKTRPTKLSI